MKRWLFFGLLVLVALGITSAAVVRVSDNYAIPLSAITCGGGASDTAVYNHPQCAIGQAGECGIASGDSYVMRTGVVQVRYSMTKPHIQGWISY
jgi:hypothetical protein